MFLRKGFKVTIVLVLTFFLVGFLLPIKTEASTNITYTYRVFYNGREIYTRTYQRPLDIKTIFDFQTIRFIWKNGRLTLDHLGKPNQPVEKQPEKETRHVSREVYKPISILIKEKQKKEVLEVKQHQALTPDEFKMVKLVNQERLERGLPPLKIDMELVRIARMKSQDMVTNGYFSHYSPTYGSPFNMLKKAGINYLYAGENIAGAPTVETAHNALMNSPGHRKNILNPNYTHIGIGIIEGGPYGKMFTQIFVGR